MRTDRSKILYRVSIGIMAVIFLTTSFGCEPLRKKFRREKKKKDESQYAPVLDPIDYAPKFVNPQEKYQYHYSMWNVWERELIKSIDDKSPTKRLKYLTNQLLVNMEEMTRWIDGDKAQELVSLIEEIKSVDRKLDQPEGLRNMYGIKTQIEQSSKKVRNDLNPGKPLEYKKAP